MRAAGLLCWVLVHLAVATGGLHAAGAAGERVALVIGNADYRSVPALRNAANDAEAMSRRLEAMGFEVLAGTDLTLAGMRTMIRDFGTAATEADLALFFYAGHGIQVNGRNFLLPVDAAVEAEADLDFSALTMDLVLRQMGRGGATRIVLLDACRNNPFERSMVDGTGLTRAAGALHRGLAPIEASGGSLIGFATDPGAVAADGDGRHSPFAEALLTHIATPGLEIHALMTRVRADVYTRTAARQRPWVSSSLLSDVVLVPGPGEAGETLVTAPEAPSRTPADGATQSATKTANTPPTAGATGEATAGATGSAADATPDAALEIAVWQAAESGDAVADLEAYLTAYPEGAFAALARNRIARLRDETPDAGAQGAAADAEAGEGGAAGPPGESAEAALDLDTAKRREIQQRLTLLGHATRGIDGIFGPASRGAIRAWQSDAGLPPTGYLDAAQLARMEAQTDTALAAVREGQRQAAGRAASAARAARMPEAGEAGRETASAPVGAATPVPGDAVEPPGLPATSQPQPGADPGDFAPDPARTTGGTVYRVVSGCPPARARGKAINPDRQVAIQWAVRRCVANGGGPPCCRANVFVSP